MGFKLLTSVLYQNPVTRKVMTSPHALEAFESNADDQGKLVAVGKRSKVNDYEIQSCCC